MALLEVITPLASPVSGIQDGTKSNKTLDLPAIHHTIEAASAAPLAKDRNLPKDGCFRFGFKPPHLG